MRDIREVYPDVSEPFLDQLYDYHPLLGSFGFRIVLQVNDNVYQGDSRILFQDGKHFGLLIFGWGSCSACDALRACETYDDVDNLRRQLLNEIKWGTAEELLAYIENKDWELEWCAHEGETRKFIDEAKEYLRERIRGIGSQGGHDA